MWAIGYVALMRPGVVAGEALFAVMVLAALVGGFVGGKLAASEGRRASARGGVLVGLACATTNLLIIGSLFDRDTEARIWQDLGLWVAGLYASTAVIAAIGGLLAGTGRRWRPRMSATAIFALTTCAAIFLLLVTGGLVTGLEAGLAVPDWPNSFGHNMLLYPIAEMKGGVYYEHAHRLYGMLVGLSAITLLVLVLRNEPSRAVRALAVVGFLMVVTQGILGGMRVTGHLTFSQSAGDLAPSVRLAVVHGVLGQLVFAVYCLIAIMCSQRWCDVSTQPSDDDRRGRRLSSALVVVLLIQLISGALYRHYQIPVPDAAPKHPAWAMHMHLTWAVVALVTTLFIGLRAMRFPKALRPLPQLGHGILMLVGIQVLLGIGSLVAVIVRKGAEIPTSEVVLTSLHQVTGALLLGTSVMLAAWWRRLTSAGVHASTAKA